MLSTSHHSMLRTLPLRELETLLVKRDKLSSLQSRASKAAYKLAAEPMLVPPRTTGRAGSIVSCMLRKSDPMAW